MTDFSVDQLEHGRWLFAQPCNFMLGVASLPQLPPADLPEIALIGRSNVGKSSLLNALTGRGNLARVSNTPGRTQQLNFFNLAQQLVVVDVPGYGYAKAPKDEIKKWVQLIKDYLRGRVTLQRVFMLVDGRHGFKESDQEILKLLDTSAVVTQLVMTKIDLVKPADLIGIKTQLAAASKKHPAIFPEILAVSSNSGAGMAELRATIAALTTH